MGKKRLVPLSAVNFQCRACGHKFKTEPDKVASAPDLEHHPFEYEHECPECGGVAEHIAWEKNLLKAQALATGPKTAEGKAASAQNLEGHPTAEEAQITRFNAMKHGLYARTAEYFPAKPGSYDRCVNCEHLETQACLEPPRACLKKHELMLRNHIAFETNDPGLLRQIHGDNHAGLQSLISDIFLAIYQDGGPRITKFIWYYDKAEGKPVVSEYMDSDGKTRPLTEIKAHPLLHVLIDIMSKNSMTLADMGMTVKVQDEHEHVKGFLDREAEDREAEGDYRERMLEGQRKLQQMIGNSYAAHEPVTVDGEVVDHE